MNRKTIVLVLLAFAAGAGCAAWYMYTHTPEYQLRAKMEREIDEYAAERADLRANWRPPAGELDSPAWFPDSLGMPFDGKVQTRDRSETLPGFEGVNLGTGRHAVYYHLGSDMHVYVFPSPGDDPIDQLLRHEPGQSKSRMVDGKSPRRWASLTYGSDPNAKTDIGHQPDRNYEFWNVGGYLVAFHVIRAVSTDGFAHAYMKATDGRKK